MGNCCGKKRSPAINHQGSLSSDMDMVEVDTDRQHAEKEAQPTGFFGGFFGGHKEPSEAGDGASGRKKKKGDDDGDSVSGKEKKKRKDKDGEENVLKLEITIVGAKGLRAADFTGESDPYVIVEIPSRTKPGKKKAVGKTPVIDNTRNPEWNHTFRCSVRQGDPIDFGVWDKDMFTDDFLGKVTCDSNLYYPFGYNGELRLLDTGEEGWAHLKIVIKNLTPPKKEEVVETGEKALEGLNFEENNVAWRKAHAVVNAMEMDENLAKEETTSTALETLIRLAESGLPIPQEALERVVVCLHGTDRRYRLASLMICKALGKRIIPFAEDIARVLSDNDEDVRAGAIKVLANFGEAATPYVSQLGDLLLDEALNVRSAALEALGVLSQADNLQALVVLGQCLDHTDKRYRLACCLILKALGVKATPHAYALAERVTEDASIDVRIAACGTLGNVGVGADRVQPALASLYKAEKDPDTRVQAAATEALEKLGKKAPPRPADDEAAPGGRGRGRGRGNSNDNAQAADNNLPGSSRGRGRGRASNSTSNEPSVPTNAPTDGLSVPTDSQVSNGRGRGRGRGRGSSISSSSAIDFSNSAGAGAAAPTGTLE